MHFMDHTARLCLIIGLSKDIKFLMRGFRAKACKGWKWLGDVSNAFEESRRYVTDDLIKLD